MTDPFLSLLIFFVVDISIGILCAVKTKKFEFEELVFGIIKKCVILIVIGVFNTIGTHVLNAGSVLREITLYFFIIIEIRSVFSKMVVLGIKLPDKAVKLLRLFFDDVATFSGERIESNK